ncbi:MAG: hypothetical protein WC979_02950 [Candidatus Pacearchaeota archaeon]|jgi:hypothetical protein|nr:hypothetical protein [Clostridia bacterium]
MKISKNQNQKQIKFHPSIGSDKIYLGTIWQDNINYLTIGNITDLNGRPIYFPPLMLNSKYIFKSQIINS